MFRDLSQSLLRPTSNDTVGNGYAIGGVVCPIVRNECAVRRNSATHPKICASCGHAIGSKIQNVGERQRVGVGVNHVKICVESQNAVGSEEVGWTLHYPIGVGHDGAIGLGICHKSRMARS